MTVNYQPDLIILISGKARAGKTTFAKTLTHRLIHRGFNTIALPLAEALKQEAALNKWDGKKNIESRTLLQTIGECRRAEDIDYWCKKISSKINDFMWDIVVIDDLRYRSELDYFQRNYSNVIPVRLTRYYNGTLYNNGLTKEQQNHISEIDLDDVDFRVKYNIEEGLQYNQSAVSSFFSGILIKVLKNNKII